MHLCFFCRALVLVKVGCILLSFMLLPLVPSEAAVAKAVGAAVPSSSWSSSAAAGGGGAKLLPMEDEEEAESATRRGVARRRLEPNDAQDDEERQGLTAKEASRGESGDEE
jgi:hypothetical protein